MNRYRKGRIAERKVMNRLEELGWYNIRRSKGSRGPADIYARTPSGTKAYIQMKSGSAEITREEVDKVRSLARKRGGVAVYCEGLIMNNIGDEKFDEPHFMIGEIVGEMETLPVGDDKLSMKNWVRSYFLRHRYKTKWFKKVYLSKVPQELEEPISIFSHLRESESSGRRIFQVCEVL